ncbi:hypothetical protein AB0B25_30775, partial [Nocardia sp. NPDC049190]|uniref:hypothetical protein n=1 Tax=Nocardia sp. NPDC049190 TaxID=3155650 RepID=UPI0033CAC581
VTRPTQQRPLPGSAEGTLLRRAAIFRCSLVFRADGKPETFNVNTQNTAARATRATHPPSGSAPSNGRVWSAHPRNRSRATLTWYYCVALVVERRVRG